jgi:hypothetical protein
LHFEGDPNDSTPEALHASSRRQRRRIVTKNEIDDPEGVEP